MLGYDIEFGHTMVVSLINATKFEEKQVGYTATAVLLNESHEFLRMVINSVREDIIGKVEHNQCLGLALVANVGGREFSDSIAADVQRILCSPSILPVVRKKAALCLLRLYRKNKEIVIADTWAPKMVKLLDNEDDLGILLGVMSLLIGIVSHDYRGYEGCIPSVCAVMQRLARAKSVPQDYLYYGIPSPWLQVKCMKVLQYFPTPSDPDYVRAETEVIHHVLTNTGTVKNVNKNNALHAVLFEAVNLVTNLDLPNQKSLLTESVAALGRFLDVNEPNIVYLGMSGLTRVCAPDTIEAVQSFKDVVVDKLNDADISIRKRALDLLYEMCDANVATDIVDSLLRYLITADFAIREELALKTAVLAEKYSAGNARWYLDVALKLVEKAGDFISDDVWHRVVHVVTDAPELHEHAARVALEKLRQNSYEEKFVRLAAYFLGEFGHKLGANEPPFGYAKLLFEHFKTSSPQTQQIILTALAKISMHPGADDDLRTRLGMLFRQHASSKEVELQQRAVEYFVMTNVGGNAERLRSVMEPMPEWNTQSRQSKLERSLATQNAQAADAVRVNKARSGGAIAPIAPPPNDTAEPGTPIPTMGIADLLGGAPVPNVNGNVNGHGPAMGGEGAPNGAAASPAAARWGQVRSAVVDPMSDLLSGLGVHPGQPPPAPPAQPVMDPLAASVAPAPATAPPQSNPVPTINVADCLKKLYAQDNGLLYEDPNMQIGVKSQWQGTQGRVMFYVGNKSPGTLTDVALELSGGVDGLHARLAALPTQLEPKKQTQVLLELAAAGGYRAAPGLSLRYSVPGQAPVQVPLKLPYGPHRFMQPWRPTNAQEFFAKWQEASAGRAEGKVVTVAPEIARGGLAAIQAALSSVRMTPLPGIDPNQKNLTAGSYAKYGNGGGVETYALARVESDANNPAIFRVTTASLDAGTAIGVQEAILSQLLP